MRKGLPWLAVAIAIAVTGVAILIQANDRSGQSIAYAEFSAFRDGCAVDPQRHDGISRCFLFGPGVYVLVADRPLGRTTPIASRGSCCPGTIAASVFKDRVIVVLPKLRGTVRASVIVP
jgi:hypothetical protein